MPLPPARRTAALAALAALSALASSGCHDTPAAPGSDGAGPPIDSTGELRVVATPATATLTQVGLDLALTHRDSTRVLTFERLLVDSGTAAERDESAPFANLRSAPVERVRLVAYATGAGPHRITVVLHDATGRQLSASITRTFDLPDAAYAVTPLPDLGAGAGVRWVNAKGDVAGWVQVPNGSQRPAVWSGGAAPALRVIQLPDTFDVLARRVNGAGDVLLQATVWPFTSSVAGRVLRADGTLLSIPAGAYSAYALPTDLNERRVAVVTTPGPLWDAHSTLFDVTRGAVVDSLVTGQILTLNDAGQAAGAIWIGSPYPSTLIVPRGFTLPTDDPPGTFAGFCDYVGRWFVWTPLDLDNASNLLASRCGALAFFPAGGAGLWADRYVGLGQAHMPRDGGVVASLDAGGTIFFWRPGTTRAQRLRLPNDAWRIDSLAAVNASGAIAAHGVERGTGRTAALLLTPQR